MVYGRSCFSFIAPFTIMSIVSMIIMMRFYRPSSLVLGPNASILIHHNPLFVQKIKVQSLESNSGVMLYGTHGIPPLDVVIKWTETHNVTLRYESHKEWKYYLNRGSELTISYYLSSESSPILLVIAEENEDKSQLVNPTDTDTTLSWNLIHGTGIVRQSTFMSSSYYVTLGNLHEEVKVELNIKVKASLYNTTNAYYKCALTTSSSCSFSTLYDADAAVLVSPGSQQNTSNDVWYVTYGPRWVTYMYGTGGIPLLMFWASYLFNKLCREDSAGGVRYEETARAIATAAPHTAPLLSQKDSDCSSLSSSYESIPHDEKDLEFLAAQGSVDEKFLGDGETSSSNNNPWHLCAICFDAPRNCFFLPCGHCVACFACGTRIAEEAGTCPVCRRKMKKVRKIFTI